jgi:type II secretory pathway predicted ATPase ExeA
MKNKKEATGLIHNNQIQTVTGRAGLEKSLVCARAALNFLMKKKNVNKSMQQELL